MIMTRFYKKKWCYIYLLIKLNNTISFHLPGMFFILANSFSKDDKYIPFLLPSESESLLLQGNFDYEERKVSSENVAIMKLVYKDVAPEF